MVIASLFQLLRSIYLTQARRLPYASLLCGSNTKSFSVHHRGQPRTSSVPPQATIENLRFSLEHLSHLTISIIFMCSSGSLKWTGPIGYGARHIHDRAPFSLWDEEVRKYHFPTPEQRKWIEDTYDVEGYQLKANCCYLETGNPPKPVPLTLGCMLVLFVGINERPNALIPNAGHYANPRIKGPCPHINWPQLSNSEHAHRIGILTALENLVNAKSITFLTSMTVADLVHDDNRIYDVKSLPGSVAGRSTLYRHDASPFFNEMRDLKRERQIDPARYEIPEISPLPVDYTNYLKEAPSLITTGVRRASGHGAAGTRFENLSQPTSAGIRLRNVTNGQDMMTVANHGFSFSSKVYHPGEDDGNKIGKVVSRYPELNVAFVKLAPSEAHKLSNRVYFQAEPPV